MKKIGLFLLLTCILIAGSAQSSHKKPISKHINKVIKKEGIDEGIKTYKSLHESSQEEYDFSLNQLSNLGYDLIEEGDIDDGIKILLLNCETFPDSAEVYSSIARVYYKIDEHEKSKIYYTKFLSIKKPSKLMDVILIKRLFFVPETFQAPLALEGEGFIIIPIKEIHAELDYKAIMSSVDHLSGVLGGNWPSGLTLEEDQKVLKHHEWEFENKVGFVYTVMNPSESEVLGCVYLYPSKLDEYDVEIGLWVTSNAFEAGLDEILYKTVREWVKSSWPFEQVIFPGRELPWGEFYQKLDEQDQKYEQ